MPHALALIASLVAAPLSITAMAQAGAAGWLMAPSGNDVLAVADQRASSFEDTSYTASMEIRKGGRLKKTLRFDLTMKGLDRQLIVFKAPGDVAGMKVLMQDADTLYVYSPEFKKVRRIAAHMQNQGFLGSTFTYEDMTQTKLSRSFTAELVGRKGSETWLDLTPRPGVKTTYPRVRAVIDAKQGGITKLSYYDGAGNLVREQTRSGWKRLEGGVLPTTITMRHLPSGDETTIRLSDVKVDQGVSDNLFSRRNLMRGG